jgi:hypothetical protein
MDGIFLENGPFRARPDGSLYLLDTGWNAYANVLYGNEILTG